jgi:Phage integrase family
MRGVIPTRLVLLATSFSLRQMAGDVSTARRPRGSDARSIALVWPGNGITAHTFRHTFASVLIVGLKLDPARVAAQLGHGNPAITLEIYTHLFERARHANELRTALDQGFGHLLSGNKLSTRGRNQPQAEVITMAQPSQLGK